ncbi:hypothetical protein DVH24_036592 [Malus domestica]|uniref:PGG domain-containing protein n=1 Tax=Malus domestica TaxID=3750 RepID=A0A498ILB9_MALDO|nr:hypothetical protein DVH24_036592 [Malus domestica]
MEIRLQDEDEGYKASHDEDEVYKASRTGSVESLNRLIEKDPDILLRISLQTGKTGTPLHVSALHGHAEFTKALCTINPKLVEWVDADGRTPLHLASAQGHKETVEVLLSMDAGVCLRYDEKGRIPLHYAAMRGKFEVVQKLIDKKPYSIYVKVENRSKETVLHLCIIHNQLECLKLLVERDDKNGEFLNSTAGCDGGVTILHLALMLRQIKSKFETLSPSLRLHMGGGGMIPLLLHMGFPSPDLQPTPFPYLPFNWNKRKNPVHLHVKKLQNSTAAGHRFGVFRRHQLRIRRQPITIRYLVSVEAIRAEATGVNGMSLSMLNILEYSSVAREDFSRSLEIQQILMDAGLIRRQNNENDNPNSAVVSPNPRVQQEEAAAPSEKGSKPARRCWTKFMKWLRYPSNWVVETRGMLMVVATMISTMTFQAAVNPPGGVWQNTETNSTTNSTIYRAGTAVLSYGTDNNFAGFLISNTISFLASLSVTLLLVSGFPLHNRLCTWLLSMSMCVTLTFLAFTYLIALHMIVDGSPTDATIDPYGISVLTWTALLGIVGVTHTIRFLIWVTKWLRRMFFRSKSCSCLCNYSAAVC